MAIVTRIIGTSLLTAGLGVGLAFALRGESPDTPAIAFLLGCLGAITGAVAGATREVVAAQRRKPEW